MYIFLPDEKDGLQELIQQLNSDSRLLNKRWDLQQVELSVMYIPKLKFSYEINTKKIMKELGLTKIFENNREITEIVDSPELYVSDAIHKSYIEVNEEGTIAMINIVFGCACGTHYLCFLHQV
ncbi:serpin-Z10-like [Hevea brasiliensis]|uniref:serpin-Z10-like n=1 Tax=Hevea brasiliensis TaxID=3981 RepID=UPI0025DE777D|nr:serpin-Z10-like [Hevea brasiliensis]